MEDQHRMTRKTRYMAPLALAATLTLTAAVTALARPVPQGDNDITRAEIGRFDRFLDTHPAIAQQLTKNPALVDDQQYVKSQPALEAFLQDHPEISETLRVNPQSVLRAADALPGPGSSSPSRMADRHAALSVTQVSALDNFLDAHPTISKTLGANPSLIRNRAFVADHPELSAFLQGHPDVAQDWTNNPRLAMADIRRFDDGQAKFTRDQMATMDRFMDAHPAISKQLEANPSLISGQDYLSDHPELVSFLQAHPDLAIQWRDDPQRAMTDLSRLDASQVKIAARGGAEGNLTPKQVAVVDGFLDSHPELSRQLEASPSLINSRDYLADHPELGSFLEAHPDVAEDWRNAPQVAMTAVTRFDASDANFSRGQMEKLDGFLDDRPALTRQLQEHPSLIGNKEFLAEHPDLTEFLQAHPEFASEWRNNPQAAMSDLRMLDASQSKTGGIAAGRVETFDSFLDDHPAITAELNAHPTLVNNADYVSDHPELKTFLQANREVATGLRTNPQAFMRDIGKLDKSGATTTVTAVKPTSPARMPALKQK